MSNANYVSGRAYEYAVMREWEEKGFLTIRASGSHGEFDVVAYRVNHKPIFIQCKKVTKISQCFKLIENFKASTKPSDHYYQVISVKIKGSKSSTTCTV